MKPVPGPIIYDDGLVRPYTTKFCAFYFTHEDRLTGFSGCGSTTTHAD
jgi:hypothetical protein